MVHVGGYRKKNGTYVHPHHRRRPQRRSTPSTSSLVDHYFDHLRVDGSRLGPLPVVNINNRIAKVRDRSSMTVIAKRVSAERDWIFNAGVLAQHRVVRAEATRTTSGGELAWAPRLS